MKKYDTKVKTTWDIETDNYSLVIKDATVDDVGEYTVKAYNSIGSNEFSVLVSVGDTSPEPKTTVQTVKETQVVTEEAVAGMKLVQKSVTEVVSEESTAGVEVIQKKVTEQVTEELTAKAEITEKAPVEEAPKEPEKKPEEKAPVEEAPKKPEEKAPVEEAPKKLRRKGSC